MKSRVIKKVFFPILFLTVLAACNNNKKPDTGNIQLLSDSAAYHNSASSDSAKLKNGTMAPATTIHHNTTDSHTSSHSSDVSNGAKGSNSGEVSKPSVSTNSGTATNSGTSTSQGTRKKGWSKGAQDAAIGGAAGAVGGAVISKHKGKGAVIGAAIGALGGYIIGHKKDKKDGRVSNK